MRVSAVAVTLKRRRSDTAPVVASWNFSDVRRSAGAWLKCHHPVALCRLLTSSYDRTTVSERGISGTMRLELGVARRSDVTSSATSTPGGSGGGRGVDLCAKPAHAVVKNAHAEALDVFRGCKGA